MSRLIFIINYAWNKNKNLIFIVIFQNIFTSFLPLFDIVGIGLVINALISNKAHSYIIKVIIIYLFVNLCVSIIGIILLYFQFIQERKISNIMQLDFTEDVLRINYHYVQDGSMLNLKRKAMSINPSICMTYFGKLLNHLIQLSGTIYIFSKFSPLFIVILVITLSISILITFKNRKIDYEFKNSRVEYDRKTEYLYKVMSEYRFAKEVRLNNADSFVNKKFKITIAELIAKLKTYYRKILILGLMNSFITLIQSATMYLYFSYQVFTSQITIAEYTVLLGATTLLTSVLLSFFDNLALINNICKDVDFYNEYLETMKKNSNITQSNILSEVNINFSNLIIRFEKVSFHYPGTEIPILKNINLEIKSGEHIGIVGLNGSGKTTLIKLLTRLYDPDEGRITMNGIDIKQIPYHQYSSFIGIVLQDFFLFAYSIKENLSFDKDADERKIQECIKQSGLEHKLSSLKKGINTVIYKQLDDNGIEFSGGEGQKLALARAIYKNTSVLILDEPTSALDPIAEHELFTKLNDIAEHKTALFISHRLSSTRFCNQIIVIENGEITEYGNHEELMMNNRTYAELFKAQARYYREKEVSAL